MNQFEQNQEKVWGELVVNSDPNSALTLQSIGESFREQQQFEEAEICLRKAAELAEMQELEEAIQCSIWISLGRVLTAMDRPGDAEKWLRNATSVAEMNALSDAARISANDALAELLLTMGRDEEAERFVNRRRQLIRQRYRLTYPDESIEDVKSATTVQCHTAGPAKQKQSNGGYQDGLRAEKIRATADRTLVGHPDRCPESEPSAEKDRDAS